MTISRPALSGSILTASLAVGVLAVNAAYAQPEAAVALPLGPPGLPATRTTQAVQPGVTLTTIVRGQSDPNASWTVEVAIPPSSPDPDAPATALYDRTTAEATAARLRSAGLESRVERVVSPQLADAGGELGYRVRVGSTA